LAACVRFKKREKLLGVFHIGKNHTDKIELGVNNIECGI
jgi:hypothetical protein